MCTRLQLRFRLSRHGVGRIASLRLSSCLPAPPAARLASPIGERGIGERNNFAPPPDRACTSFAAGPRTFQFQWPDPAGFRPDPAGSRPPGSASELSLRARRLGPCRHAAAALDPGAGSNLRVRLRAGIDQTLADEVVVDTGVGVVLVHRLQGAPSYGSVKPHGMYLS